MKATIDEEDVRLMGEPLSSRVIACALEVHRVMGPGLLESAYRQALVRELSLRELTAEVDVPVPFVYKDTLIPCVYRADLIVSGKLLLELKSIDSMRPVHESQLLTYLKLGGLRVGLLMNFNCPTLRAGLKRFVR